MDGAAGEVACAESWNGPDNANIRHSLNLALGAGAPDALDPAPAAAVLRSDGDMCIALVRAFGAETGFLSQGETSGGRWSTPMDPRMPGSDAEALKRRYIEDTAIINAAVDREVASGTPSLQGDADLAGHLRLLAREPRSR